jgi:hypothetical protein
MHLVTVLKDLKKINVEMIAIIIIPEFLDELYDNTEVVIRNHQVFLLAHMYFEVDVLDNDRISHQYLIDVL